MSYTTLDSIQWGGTPLIGVSFAYEGQRSGSSMEYRIRVTIDPLTGASYFGYPIYLSVYVDGSGVTGGYTMKAASPNRWSEAITYDSGWVTVTDPGGYVPLTIRLYSGSGSTRDDSYSYVLPVERVEDIGDFSLTAGSAAMGQPLTLTVTRPGYGYSCAFSYTFAGVTDTPEEAAIQAVSSSGVQTPQATVTDSRGRSISVSGTAIRVYEYSPPVITSSMAVRCNELGEARDDGKFFKLKCAATCSPLAGQNEVTVRVQYRPMGGGVWSGGIPIENGAEVITGGNMDESCAYEIELSAEDTVGTLRTVRYTSATKQVTVHLRSGGTGLALGKYAEKDGLECAWPASFYGDVAVSGSLKLNGVAVEEKLLPVGSVRLTATADAPELPGTWQQVQAGLSGVYAWRRVT